MFGHWNLKFGYYLLFDNWNLGFFRRTLDIKSLLSESFRADFDGSLHWVPGKVKRKFGNILPNHTKDYLFWMFRFDASSN